MHTDKKPQAMSLVSSAERC